MIWRPRLLSFVFPQNGSGSGTAAAAGESPAEIFSRVYRDKHWGRRWGRKFCSGQGSYEDEIVGPYVRSVRGFLSEFSQPPRIVDLGCGDFHVGSRIREVCAHYVACDVVPELIEHNRRAFGRLQVEFACLNIIDDPLPPGEVVFIRQVLQHLSNAQIACVVPKLAQYRFVVITEHLPGDPAFNPNIDHQFGSGTRVKRNSGVILTAPPFNFKAVSERLLCSVEYGKDLIRTIAYGL